MFVGHEGLLEDRLSVWERKGIIVKTNSMFVRWHRWCGQHEELDLDGGEQFSLRLEGNKLTYV